VREECVTLRKRDDLFLSRNERHRGRPRLARRYLLHPTPEPWRRQEQASVVVVGTGGTLRVGSSDDYTNVGKRF
jgi:hypothetical protein